MSLLQRVSAWFLTEKGKTFSYFFAGTVTTSVIAATSLPHTLFLDKYKDLICLYNKGVTVPLPLELKKRFERTLDLLEVNDDEKLLYKPFHVYGFDVKSAGTAYSKFGVIIGLPKHFQYKTTNDFQEDRHKIKLGDYSVIWDSDEGKQLTNSLILSEKSQMYAMAREIKHRQTVKPLIDIILSVSSCVLVYSFSQGLNTKLNLYKKPLPVRLISYTLICSLVYGLYVMGVDVSQVYFEQKIDKELKKIEVLREGAVEFYEKLLERNKALRKMLGTAGEKLYTTYGNEQYFLRTKHVPLVQRKSVYENVEVKESVL